MSHSASQRTLAVCVFMSLHACGHAESTGATAVAAPQPQAARVESSTPRPEPTPEQSNESAQDIMVAHFLLATAARDAVIDGSLDDMRDPLQALADHRYEKQVPDKWLPGVERLQLAARATARAESLTAAANGIAAIASTCGQCHREQGHQLELEPAQVETETPKSDAVESRMLRHSWAADRMWEGLVVPSEQAWYAGAQALAHAPKATPRLDPAPEGFAKALGELRELGGRASVATSQDERAEIYAQALTSCANCHRLHASFEF